MGNTVSTSGGNTPVYFPSNASEWTLRDLSTLNISYNNSATDLSDFMDMLIRGSDDRALSNIDLPVRYKFVSTQTERWWTFSFEFDDRIIQTDEEKTRNVRRGDQDSAQALVELREERDTLHFQRHIDEGISRDTFYRWKQHLEDFFIFFRQLLDRWGTESQRKGRFTHLFMLFLRTCLLRPEPGLTYHETLKIEDIQVGGDPDARLKAYSSSETIAVIEVKPENVFTVDQGYENLPIDRQMQPKLLGQHGIELLLQKNTSIFASGVAGIVCVGTRVFFTFLKITEDHFSNIVARGDVDNAHRATIFYTKPFDFMKPTERKQLMETLLKFAVVQSGDNF